MAGLVHYRLLWWGIALPPVFLALWAVVRRPGFYARFVGPATPAELGFIRVVTAAILCGHVLVEDLPSSARLPRALIAPMGVLQILRALPIGFDRFLADPVALLRFKLATAALLFLAAAGLATRVTVPLAALAYLVFAGILRQYSAFYHAGLVPLYVLGVLAWTPCADAWSVDGLLRRARGRPVPDDRPAAVYGWSRYACWTVVALAYAAAGASKLRNGGLHWWDATNIRGIYYRTSLNPMHFDWRVSLRLVGLPDAVVEILGILSVALEVGFVAVLFSRMARRVLPLAMIGFHVVVFFLQNLLFLDLILLQSIFWERRGERAAPAPDARPGRAALVAAAAAVVCAAWLVRVEFYPLTAMQMFSWRARGTSIDFYRVIAHHRSGATGPAPLRGCAYRTFAITPVVKKAFDPVQRPICAEYLETCAARYNARVRDPVDRFELEKWVWDLRADPTGAHASLVARYAQDVS